MWVALIETLVSQYRYGWPVYILLNCTFDACHFNWLSYHILSYIRKTILHCHGFSPALFQPPTCPADYFNTFPTLGLAILFLKMLWLCRYKHCFPCHELKAITYEIQWINSLFSSLTIMKAIRANNEVIWVHVLYCTKECFFFF